MDKISSVWESTSWTNFLFGWLSVVIFFNMAVMLKILRWFLWFWKMRDSCFGFLELMIFLVMSLASWGGREEKGKVRRSG